MTRPAADRPRMSRTAGLAAAVAAALGAWAAVVAVLYGLERATLWRDRNKGAPTPSAEPSTPARGPSGPTRRFDAPGLATPPAVPAGGAGLADDEEVIGVVAGGRPRAYRLRALEHPPWHIVNDVVGGVPVTVAHCDLSGCTRAYAGEPGGGPLDVAQAGLVDGEMAVKARGVAYSHRTGRPLDSPDTAPALPYPEHEWVRTTWRAWRERHPTTDVFVGLPGRRLD